MNTDTTTKPPAPAKQPPQKQSAIQRAGFKNYAALWLAQRNRAPIEQLNDNTSKAAL